MTDKIRILKNLNSCIRFVKLDELNLGKVYPIAKFEKIITMNGDAICLTLEDGDNSFKVFLPSSYNTKIADIDLMNSLGLKIKYNGKTIFSNGRSKHDIEFI